MVNPRPPSKAETYGKGRLAHTYESAFTGEADGGESRAGVLCYKVWPVRGQEPTAVTCCDGLDRFADQLKGQVNWSITTGLAVYEGTQPAEGCSISRTNESTCSPIHVTNAKASSTLVLNKVPLTVIRSRLSTYSEKRPIKS